MVGPIVKRASKMFEIDFAGLDKVWRFRRACSGVASRPAPTLNQPGGGPSDPAVFFISGVL